MITRVTRSFPHTFSLSPFLSMNIILYAFVNRSQFTLYIILFVVSIDDVPNAIIHIFVCYKLLSQKEMEQTFDENS